MKRKIENLDDVVFENRNKNYGAYFLRRNYNSFVARALFFSILFVLGLVSIPLLAGLFDSERDINLENDTIVFEDLLTPPDEKEEIELPKEQPLAEKVPAFKIKVVDSTEIADTTNLFALFDGIGNDLPPDISDTGSLIITIVKPPVLDNYDEPIFIDVAEMPDFVGGIEKMYAYLGKNVHYPQIAIDNGITGKVHVKFVVEKDGSISNTELLNDIGGGCGDEALRVVRSMPKWKPGKQNGNLVRVQFVLPINFILNN